MTGQSSSSGVNGTSDPSQGTRTRGLGTILMRGSALMILVRWGMRLIGLGSTVVLARLLAPEDFGLISMAMLVSAAVSSFTQLGVDAALIQNQEAGRTEFDTAWTLQILQRTALAVGIALLAPFAATYFNEPRVTSVVWILAVSIFLQGFENIGVVNFQRDLWFGREGQYQILQKVIQVASTITLAFILHNHWALILGILCGSIGRLALSYSMSNYRPTLTLRAFRTIWSFSKWMLVMSFGRTLQEVGERFVIGRLASTATMGGYTVGSQVARLPTEELTAAIERTMLPGLASVKHDPPRLYNAFTKALGAFAIVVTPVGFGILAIAEQFVRILLGEKWLSAVPIVEIAAADGVVLGLASIPAQLLLAGGFVRNLAFQRIAEGIFLISSAYLAFTFHGVVGVALAKVSVATVFLLILIGQMSRLTAVGYRATAKAVWRPLFSGVVMIFAVRAMDPVINLSLVLDCAINVITGAIVYTGVLLAAWMVSGREEGPEKEGFTELVRRVRKRSRTTDNDQNA